MSGLFHAHSGLRFLVLVLGVGLVRKVPYSKVHRILGASFAGALHLQVVLGVTMVAMGRYYRRSSGTSS